MPAPSLMRILRLGAAPVTAVLAIALAACSGGTGAETGSVPSGARTPSSDPVAPAAEPPASASTAIVIVVDEEAISGELDDSPASASLVALLPLTLSFRDYGRQEKIAELPAPLDLDGAPEGSDAAPLTIGYYAPSQALVLYYEHVGYFPGIVPLGTFRDAKPIGSETSGFSATIHAAS
jgi:hypothetical protein